MWICYQLLFTAQLKKVFSGELEKIEECTRLSFVIKKSTGDGNLICNFSIIGQSKFIHTDKNSRRLSRINCLGFSSVNGRDQNVLLSDSILRLGDLLEIRRGPVETGEVSKPRKW